MSVHDKLTGRQAEVFNLLCKGHSNCEIASGDPPLSLLIIDSMCSNWCRITTLAIVLASCRTANTGSETLAAFRNPPIATATVREFATEPISELESGWSQEAREWVQFSEDSTPASIPTLAFSRATWINPDTPGQPARIIPVVGGRSALTILHVNTGSNPFISTILCLRNEVQVNCSPVAQVWSAPLQPHFGAHIPIDLSSAPGDRLTFLYLADRESQRVQTGSNLVQLYAGQEPESVETSVSLPSTTSNYGGCDFIALIKDPGSSDPDNTNLMRGVARGTTLFVLIKGCDSDVGGLSFRLVAIQDQNTIVVPSGDAWSGPVSVTGSATVIPLDTSVFGSAREFQIALIPLNQTTSETFRFSEFTQAVSLVDP